MERFACRVLTEVIFTRRSYWKAAGIPARFVPDSALKWFGPSAWPSDHPGVEIRSPETDTEFELYYDLRWRVLRAPWGRPRGSERDALDASATHIAGYDEAKRLVAIGRLHAVEAGVGQVRYMAVEEAMRGRGLGQAVLDELERLAKWHGMKAIILDAREAAEGFYLRNGYVATGDGHTLFGEVRHTKMEKLLTGSA